MVSTPAGCPVGVDYLLFAGRKTEHIATADGIFPEGLKIIFERAGSHFDAAFGVFSPNML